MPVVKPASTIISNSFKEVSRLQVRQQHIAPAARFPFAQRSITLANWSDGDGYAKREN